MTAAKASTETNKDEALRDLLATICKKQGDGAIMMGQTVVPVEAISTGSLTLDVAIGVGGLPRGRICEIYGPESCGKTTLALHVVANAQRNGGKAAYIDAEHALDPTYARNIGVDIDALLISQPDSGEDALETVNLLAGSGLVDVIVVDSVAALVPKAELEGSMGESHMGAHARLMSQALRKLKGIVHQHNVCLVFINQLREKIGMVFGNPEVTPGGRALKFYASVRLEVKRTGKLSNKDNDNYGNSVKATVVKNKVAPPFRTAEFEIIFGKGVNQPGCIVSLADKYKILEKRGSNYYYKGNRVANGETAMIALLVQDPALSAELEQAVLDKIGVMSGPQTAAEGESSEEPLGEDIDGDPDDADL
jgi:recombination protein RecA